MTNPWDKIFIDDFESAFKIADKNFKESSSKLDLRSRAIASFLLRNYKESLADFLSINEIEKQTNSVSDGTYLDIALCYYAIGDLVNAIEYYKFPITNRREIVYTSDVSIPPSVLLYFGTKLGNQDLVKIAIKELKRLSKKLIPGPNYLLGLIEEKELNKEFEELTNDTLRNRKKCKVEFYKAVKELTNGNFDKSKEHLNYCADLKGKYLEYVYYLAKVEKENNSH